MDNNDLQEIKRRMVQAEKVAKRLWKALELLDSTDREGKPKTPKTIAEALEFRDTHVREGEHGILELKTE